MNRTAVRNVVAVSLSVTLLIVALVAPHTLVNRRAPVIDAVVQTLIALAGTLVAFLMIGRYRRHHDVGDLLLFFAVLLLAWVHTLFRVVPDLISPASVGNGWSERIEIWGASTAKFLAAWYVLRSAMVADRHLDLVSPRRRYHTLYTPALIAGLSLVLLAWFVPVSHSGLAYSVPASEMFSVLVEFVGAALFFVAGWQLTREAEWRSDSFVSWIAAGCVFGGFAMISTGLFGARDGTWLQPSDVFRVGLVTTWAWGAVLEIRRYWATISESSRRDAQRSVAFDLHDGMAQELALITSYLYAPAEEREQPEWHRQMQNAAERALADVRRTITVLSDDPTPAVGLRRATVGHRDEGTTLVAGLEDPLARESVVRVVREAVSNALRHGRASTINIQVSADDWAPSLRVVDDGVGFDPAGAVVVGHHGIESMREQAAALGATLVICSTPGGGTSVELRWS